MPESSTPRLLTTAQLVQEQQSGALVLDTRPAEQFASFHIRGSIQISLLGYFAAWAAILIDPAQKLLLVAEDVKSAQEAHNRLTRVGVDRVIGYSLAHQQQWHKEGIELGNISTQRCAHVHLTLQCDPSVQLIDVRSRAEWLKGHLPRAISIPLLDLIPKRGPSIRPSQVLSTATKVTVLPLQPAFCFERASGTSAF